MKDLEGDGSIVPEVLRQEDGRHPPAAELALDRVAIRQSGRELASEVGHQVVPATSFWNRGFFRSGSNVGSILSQAGVR